LANLTLNLDGFVISSHCRGRARGKAYLKGRSSKEEKVDFTTLTAWGFNGNGQLGNGTTNSSTPVEVSDLVGVKAIAAGGSHSLAVQ
jgi:alpha-tubulin suppressor-like RCC1 family protein